MFCCQSLFLDQPNPIDSLNQTQISLPSDEPNNQQKTLRINKSLYDQYLKNCGKSPFTDPQFPPNYSSLQFSVPGRTIIWKRISEIIPNFTIFSDPIQNKKIQYANLDDNYFFPTVSAIAKDPKRIKNIFHFSNNKQKSCIYRLIVKQSGTLKQLVIDDYIPIFGDSYRPVFCKTYGQQIWPILLQKAWAKLKGSYNAILKGCPHEVLTAFCFGPSKLYNVDINDEDSTNNIEAALKDASRNKYLICATSAKDAKIINISHEQIASMLNLGQQNSSQPSKKQSNGSDIKMLQINSKYLESIAVPPQSPSNKHKNIQINLKTFINQFERIDINYDNESFSYHFQQIVSKPNKPIFFQFQVQEDHNAFISLSKQQFQIKFNGKLGLILSSQSHNQQKEQFQFQQGVIERQFSDCFIQIPKFPIGKHILLLYYSIEQPSSQQQNIQLTLGYSFANLTKGSRTIINQINPTQQFYKQFMETVLLSFGSRLQNNKDIKMYGESIQCVNLFKAIGFGYIVCEISSKSQFRIKIVYNKSEICKSGVSLIGNYQEQQTIFAGNKMFFLFQLRTDSTTILFPPNGFKITKII